MGPGLQIPSIARRAPPFPMAPSLLSEAGALSDEIAQNVARLVEKPMIARVVAFEVIDLVKAPFDPVEQQDDAFYLHPLAGILRRRRRFDMHG
jgi:hypothetical protein